MYKRKCSIIIILLILCCFLFISCNKKTDSNAIDPRNTTISEIEGKTKNQYVNFPIRILNPAHILPNLSPISLKNDRCIKNAIYSDFRYFLSNSHVQAIPTYYFYTNEMTDLYYDAMYKDMDDNNAFKSLYDNYESMNYELEGFSFHITIRKNDTNILSSIPKGGLSSTNLDDSKVYLDRYDGDMNDFSESTYITSNLYDGLLKWRKYQAKGKYNDIEYKTCTIISPENGTKTNHCFSIKNTIKVAEEIKGYNISYYISDFSHIKIITSIENIEPESMDSILEPLKDKTIDMAKAFIDYSLSYLE